METLRLFKRSAAVLGTLLAFSAAVHAADPSTFPAPVGDRSIIPAGAKLELIFDGGCMLTEGVAAGHDGMIYFSDITFTKFGRDGNMIAALGADYGGRMLVKTDMKTGKTYILSGLYNGRPYNALNDITIDEKGRIYFSDPRYLGHEGVYQDGFAVYRLDPAGC